MKKIILSLMMVASCLMAEGFVVGGEIGYGNAEITASAAGISASAKTKSKSGAIKAGYQFDNVRVLGTINADKYKDDMIMNGEGKALSFGIELDYVEDNLFIGVTASNGDKDLVTFDQDFLDLGARVGGIFEIQEGISAEIGVQYKERKFDTYNLGGVGLDVEDKTVGVFIGLLFSL